MGCWYRATSVTNASSSPSRKRASSSRSVSTVRSVEAGESRTTAANGELGPAPPRRWTPHPWLWPHPSQSSRHEMRYGSTGGVSHSCVTRGGEGETVLCGVPAESEGDPMRRVVRLAVGAGAVLGLSTLVAPVVAGADPPGPWFSHGADHVVFVQTDNTAGNQVVAYDRADNGSLTQAGTYDTGGLGGQLTGSVVDHLASQGSLTYDSRNALLYAVNAGSNTVSVFAVRGDRLALRQVVSSGGTFPVSVAVHGNLVYVLNPENGGSVQGYVSFFGHLFAIPGSNRPLGLDPTATPQFVNTPGQVAFSPDGSQLIVTTKANGSDIDVFAVRSFGWLSATPVVNSEPGAVPFAINFDSSGHLVIAEAGT